MPLSFEYAGESDRGPYSIPRTRGFPRQARVVLRALNRYGAFVAENGSSAWYVSGAPSRGWNNEDPRSFHRVRGNDFEVVDTSRLPRP